MFVEPGGVQCPAKGGQRVEQSGDLVDQGGVVVLPARLVLFRSVVMVDRVEHTGGLHRRGAQHQGGLAAVGADLNTDAAVEVAQRSFVECAALVFGHETGHPLGEGEQPPARIVIAHRLNLTAAPTRW